METGEIVGWWKCHDVRLACRTRHAAQLAVQQVRLSERLKERSQSVRLLVQALPGKRHHSTQHVWVVRGAPYVAQRYTMTG